MHLWTSVMPSVALLSSFAAGELCWSQSHTSTERAWKIVESAWNTGSSNKRVTIEGKLSALEAVAELRDTRATNIFREAITGSNPIFKFQAACRLDAKRTGDLLPEVTAALAGEREQNIRAPLITAISKLDAMTALPLLVPLASRDGEKVIIDTAFGALMRFGPGAAESYAAILASGCEYCREVAANLLWRTGAPATAIPALQNALSSANAQTALFAAAALAAVGERSGTTVLKAGLGDKDHGRRDVAAVALCQLGDMSGREVLLAELHSGDPGRQFAAARAVGRSGLESLGALLKASLSDATAELRSGALAGIAEGPGEMAAPTADALADSDASVRYMVANNLLKRGDRQRADPLLRGLSQDRDRAGMVFDMLAEYGASTVAEQELALKELHSDSVGVQVSAITALRLAGQSGFTAIAPLLESPEPWVVRTAARTLVEMSPKDAIPYLEQGMQSVQQHVRILSAGYLLRALEVLGADHASVTF
jgi:HEAT repeat protein